MATQWIGMGGLCKDLCPKLPFVHGEKILSESEVSQWADPLGLEIVRCGCSVEDRAEVNETFHMLNHYGVECDPNNIRSRVFEFLRQNSEGVLDALKGTIAQGGEFGRKKADDGLRVLVRGIKGPTYRDLFVLCKMGLMGLKIVHEKGVWTSYEETEHDGGGQVILAMRGIYKFSMLRWKSENLEGKMACFSDSINLGKELPVSDVVVKDRELWGVPMAESSESEGEQETKGIQAGSDPVGEVDTGVEIVADLFEEEGTQEVEQTEILGGLGLRKVESEIVVEKGTEKVKPGAGGVRPVAPETGAVGFAEGLTDHPEPGKKGDSVYGGETDTDTETDEEIQTWRNKYQAEKDMRIMYQEKAGDLMKELDELNVRAVQQDSLHEGLMNENLGLRQQIRDLKAEMKQLQDRVVSAEEGVAEAVSREEDLHRKIYEFCDGIGMVRTIRAQIADEERKAAEAEAERVREQQQKLLARSQRRGMKRGSGGTLPSPSPKKAKPERTPTKGDKDDTLFYCDFEGCEKSFATQSGLNKHLPRHKEKNIRCDVEGCEKMFRVEQDLKDHVGIHTDQFLCPKCKKRQANRRACRAHAKTCNGSE